MIVVTYNPEKTDNVPAMMNKHLAENKDEKYILFIFEEIYKHVKDKTEFVRKYENLMKDVDLPYAFFPYYLHFNKILPDSAAKPSPRAHVTVTDKNLKFDIVAQPAFGMLLVDVQKLNSINFKFNEEYKFIFYLQDLIKKCHENKIGYSSSYFLDVTNSYELFDDSFNSGFFAYPFKDFVEEKKKYIEKEKQPEFEQINSFIELLKTKFGKAQPVEISK